MSHHPARIHISPRLAESSLPAGLVLSPCLLSVSPDSAGGRWGLYPGRQLQLSPQWLSLPQAPLPEVWLEVRWHGCSALAACKWIAAPPGPALTLTPSPAPQAPGTGTHPSPCSPRSLPSSWCQAGRGWACSWVWSWAGRRSCPPVSCPPHPDMRRDVQEIFRLTPHEKQCMMFSATLSKEIRPVCRKFMQDVSRARWWPRPQWISFGPPGPGPRTGAQHPHCPHGTATLTGRGALSPLSRQTGS